MPGQNYLPLLLCLLCLPVPAKPLPGLPKTHRAVPPSHVLPPDSPRMEDVTGFWTLHQEDVGFSLAFEIEFTAAGAFEMRAKWMIEGTDDHFTHGFGAWKTQGANVILDMDANRCMEAMGGIMQKCAYVDSGPVLKTATENGVRSLYELDEDGNIGPETIFATYAGTQANFTIKALLGPASLARRGRPAVLGWAAEGARVPAPAVDVMGRHSGAATAIMPRFLPPKGSR